MSKESLIDLLREIANSDMAQREEDEGRVSPLLNKVRAVIAAAQNHTPADKTANRSMSIPNSGDARGSGSLPEGIPGIHTFLGCSYCGTGECKVCGRKLVSEASDYRAMQDTFEAAHRKMTEGVAEYSRLVQQHFSSARPSERESVATNSLDWQQRKGNPLMPYLDIAVNTYAASSITRDDVTHREAMADALEAVQIEIYKAKINSIEVQEGK